MLELSTIGKTRVGETDGPEFEAFADGVVTTARTFAADDVLALADRLHDVLRARRSGPRPASRYAVVRCGEAWRIVSGRGRIGRFDDWNDAFAFCSRLAREAVDAGHEVELLVQSECGELLPV